MSKFPNEVYIWDETPESPGHNLNLNVDGSRPTPGEDTEKGLVRAGVYRLVREVDILREVKEVEIKPAVDPIVDSWGPSSLVRNLK